MLDADDGYEDSYDLLVVLLEEDGYEDSYDLLVVLLEEDGYEDSYDLLDANDEYEDSYDLLDADDEYEDSSSVDSSTYSVLSDTDDSVISTDSSFCTEIVGAGLLQPAVTAIKAMVNIHTVVFFIDFPPYLQTFHKIHSIFRLRIPIILNFTIPIIISLEKMSIFSYNRQNIRPVRPMRIAH